MIKIVHVILLSFITCLLSTIQAQSYEIRAGIGLNKFYDFKVDDVPYNAPTYSSDLSSYFGVTIENLKIDDSPFDLSLAFENYSGSARSRTGGLGGGRAVSAEINKTLVSIGIHPFNQNIFKKLKLRAGFVVSVLLHETFSGTVTQSAGNSPTTTSLQNEYEKFNSDFYFGLQASLSYDVKVKENFILFPYYSYYLGIINEFSDFPSQTKSMRHHLGIGIRMQL